jgi:actin related protein 2/3 complex subunit 1A/1B
VGFSPSGDILAFASELIYELSRPSCSFATILGHDSSVTIVYPAAPAVITIKASTLPYVTLTWTAEDSLVAAGHDCQPVLFQGTESGWKAVGSLDDPSASKVATPTTRSGGVGRLNSAAFNTFRDADTRGTRNAPGSPTAVSTGGDTEMLTVHQNTITSVRPYEIGADGTVSKVSTTGVDGKLVIWNVTAVGGLTARLGGVKLR